MHNWDSVRICTPRQNFDVNYAVKRLSAEKTDIHLKNKDVRQLAIRTIAFKILIVKLHPIVVSL